jgi:hypothetical protein
LSFEEPHNQPVNQQCNSSFSLCFVSQHYSSCFKATEVERDRNSELMDGVSDVAATGMAISKIEGDEDYGSEDDRSDDVVGGVCSD